uniref:Uncharacterized protein n=1 Tax=Candidatus Kentrum sp. DK TaxID=2126562 RepID=A0A450SQY9_9GAMM|nr:MAG: hypothetical protein BECKDK2373C_GA0170839_105330 [Candidatus Kentron sp. DK]
MHTLFNGNVAIEKEGIRIFVFFDIFPIPCVKKSAYWKNIYAPPPDARKKLSEGKSRIVLHNKAKTDEKAEFIGNK